MNTEVQNPTSLSDHIAHWCTNAVTEHPYQSIFVAVIAAGILLVALTADQHLAVGLAVFGLVPAIPVLMFVAWLERLMLARKLFATFWFKILAALITALVAVEANAWAQEVVASAFNVPPGMLPLTQTVMTLAYIPGVILHPIFAVGLYGIITIGAIVLVALLVTSRSPSIGLWNFAKFMLIVFAISFSWKYDYNFKADADKLANLMAYRLDFRVHNPCKNLDLNSGDRVLQLDLEKALVYHFNQGDASENLKIVKCEVRVMPDFEPLQNSR